MPSIKINVNPSVFSTNGSKYNIKISKDNNNGLSLNDKGQIVATKGNDGPVSSGGTMNVPGNAVSGKDGNTVISVARFNSSVSRRTLGDSGEEGLLMSVIVSGILANI